MKSARCSWAPLLVAAGMASAACGSGNSNPGSTIGDHQTGGSTNSTANPNAGGNANTTLTEPLGGASNTGAVGPNLCAGLVTDKVAHPMAALAKPAVMTSYRDSAFGTTIRRITDVGSGIIKPLYSPTQAWNADESYLLLYQVEHGHRLYDGKTYAFIRDVAISPPDIEQVYWDTSDPDILYYIDGIQLVRYHVAADQKENYRTLTTCRNQAAADSHAWISWDSRFLGLQCDGTGPSFIYDIGAGTVTGSSTANPERGAPSMGASGALARWDIEVVDDTLKTVRTIDVPVVEHSSLGRLANGHDTYDAVVFDQGPRGSGVGTLVTHDMTDGTARVIVGPDTGYPYPPTGTHVSAVVYENPGWVFVSVVGDISGKGVLDQELLLANTNAGVEVVCRIGHHRSQGKEGPNGYWAEPHVTGSPTGTRAVFASDWSGGATVDTYVVELPSYLP